MRSRTCLMNPTQPPSRHSPCQVQKAFKHSLKLFVEVAASGDSCRPAPRRRALGTCHAARAARWTIPPPPQARTPPPGQARPCYTEHLDQIASCVYTKGKQPAPDSKLAPIVHTTHSDGWNRHAHSVPPRQVGYVHTALLVNSVMVALKDTQQELSTTSHKSADTL